jgi:hypothetical protein
MNTNQLFTRIALFNHYSIFDILQDAILHLTGSSMEDINRVQKMCVDLINSHMNPLIKSHLVCLLRKRQSIIAKEICLLQVEESDNQIQFIPLGEKLSDDFDQIPLEIMMSWDFDLVYTTKTDRYGRTVYIVSSEYCTTFEIPVMDELQNIDDVMSDWNAIQGRSRYDCTRCSYPVFKLLKEFDSVKSSKVIEAQKTELKKWGIGYTIDIYDLIDKFINSGFKSENYSNGMLGTDHPIILRLVDVLYHNSVFNSDLCQKIKDSFVGFTYLVAGFGNLAMYQFLSRYAINLNYGLDNAYQNGMVNVVEYIMETSNKELCTHWSLRCSRYRTFKMIDYCLSQNLLAPILSFSINNNRKDVIDYLNEKGFVITMNYLKKIVIIINEHILNTFGLKLDILCYLFEKVKFDVPNWDEVKKLLPELSMDGGILRIQMNYLTNYVFSH